MIITWQFKQGWPYDFQQLRKQSKQCNEIKQRDQFPKPCMRTWWRSKLIHMKCYIIYLNVSLFIKYLKVKVNNNKLLITQFRMEINRKAQAAQQKQWRQQWKILTRKIDESQKSYLKILTTICEVNPEIAAKTHAIITDYDGTGKKNEKESQVIYSKLRKINQTVDQLRETLKYFDRTNQSLIKVQKLSEGIFGKMQNMKNQMADSYDQVDDLERKLTGDLQMLDRRIQGFDDEENYQKSEPNTKKIKNKQNNSEEDNRQKIRKVVSKEQRVQEQQQEKSKIQIIEQKMKKKQEQVERVDEQMRQMGKFLGWHEQDHKDFITIWNRNQPNKNYFQIQDQMVEYFKMYTNQQIIEHMNKYMKYKKLTQKKKYLINQYKEFKQEKKSEEINKLKSNQQEIFLKLKKEQQIKRSEQEQKQLKQKVELWKKQKQEQKLIQKQKLSEQQERKKREQYMRRKQEENKRKQILDQWKNQQEEKKQKQSKQAQKRPHSAVNKQVRDRIREREEQTIKQKMQRAIEKKIYQQQLQKKAEKIREQKLIKYAHVKPKLEEKTTAVKQKQRQKFDGKNRKDANTFGGQILLTGIRAIPEWRQGL